MSKTNPARGMRDFLPADVRKREYVIGIIKEVYESYGFEPLETPAVENLDTLMGKYGDEGNQLIFKILKRGEKLAEVAKLRSYEVDDEPSQLRSLETSELSDLALRYDLTVPLARVVAHHRNELPKFFKRYQIQPVWRADRPAKGRFREFYQCDVDAIGSVSMAVEAEQIAAVSEILTKLGFADFTIRVNHRKLLMGILRAANVQESREVAALTAIDKIDKIGREGVANELLASGISRSSQQKLLSFIDFFMTAKSTEVFDDENKRKLLSILNKIDLEFGASAGARSAIERADELGKRSTDDTEALQELIQTVEAMLESFRDYKRSVGIVFNPLLANLARHRIIDSLHSELLNVVAGEMVSLRPLLGAIPFIAPTDTRIEGVYELARIIKLVKKCGNSVPIVFDPTLARGLSYYTGTIFEINVPDLAGSLGGGGRYDGLIGMFGKEQIPACGFSLGLERIIVVMDERGMFPPEIAESTPADVMVTVWSEETIAESLKLAAELRSSGLRVTVYPEPDKLGKQIKYADQIKVPYVCVLGETELAEKKVTLKNMKTGEQEKMQRAEITNFAEDIFGALEIAKRHLDELEIDTTK